MKTPNKIYALIFIIVMMILISSCSNDQCKPYCGVVFETYILSNLPAHGDEIYVIEYATECGELRKHYIQFDLNDGMIGTPTQPVKKVNKGDRICL
jgi:hypothetical protein